MADDGKVEDEELDYRITFPTPKVSEVSDDEEEEEAENDTGQPEPVVILLGWMGCQEKHLAKYAAIWDQSCITIQYTCPTEMLVTKSQLLTSTATKLLELVTDLSLDQSPIIFHVFSNGGCLLYKHIIDVLHSDPQFGALCVAGTIFDSGPTKTDYAAGARALVASQSNAVIKFILSWAFFVFVWIYWVYIKVLGMFGKAPAVPHADFWDSMKNDPSRWPQMFLFSHTDQIVPAAHVLEILEHRESLGVEVREKCWDDSEHVMHFRTHTDSYLKECHYFLGLCLDRLQQ